MHYYRHFDCLVVRALYSDKSDDAMLNLKIIIESSGILIFADIISCYTKILKA
jgi:hypothetical protein